MDRISRHGRGEESVRFGDLRIASLLFADNVVLFATSDRDLQHALGGFAAKFEVVGMRVSTSKSEAMVLCWKTVECSLQGGSDLLPQVKEFKYLGVLFTSEGKMEREMDRRIGVASASNAGAVSVRWGEEGAEPEGEVLDLPVHLCSKPMVTYGHELWLVTERTRLRIQVAGMSSLRRVAGLSLRDKVRSSDIRRELGVEPLLLRVERSQLRWFRHLIKMPPGRLPLEVFRARLGDPEADPEPAGGIIYPQLASVHVSVAVNKGCTSGCAVYGANIKILSSSESWCSHSLWFSPHWCQKWDPERMVERHKFGDGRRPLSSDRGVQPAGGQLPPGGRSEYCSAAGGYMEEQPGSAQSPG